MRNLVPAIKSTCTHSLGKEFVDLFLGGVERPGSTGKHWPLNDSGKVHTGCPRKEWSHRSAYSMNLPRVRDPRLGHCNGDACSAFKVSFLYPRSQPDPWKFAYLASIVRAGSIQTIDRVNCQ